MNMLLATLALFSAANGPAVANDIVAIRVGKAETVSHGLIEHAVILVENGVITTIGQDLPIERGIPVVDYPDWTVMPGLVNAYSRAGMDGSAGDEFTPQASAQGELYPAASEYEEVREAGVTTLALYPPGRGIPGQAIVVTPHGETADEMLVKEGAYLKIEYRADARSKKRVREAFKEVDEYIEAEKKARAKWEKEKEKAEKKKKSSKKDKDDEKDDEKDEDEDDKKEDETEVPPYTPPEPDPEVVPFMQLRDAELSALVTIGQAGELLHWIDALGEEEIEWDLRVRMTRSSDLFHVADKVGELECRIVMEPEITLHPGTMRQRNIAAELVAVGAKLVFIPRSDSVSGHKSWLRSIGHVIASGLDRQVALRAVTLEPAELLGLGEELGSLEEGKRANLVFFDGDPFEASTQVKAVMIGGEFVSGDEVQ